MNLFYLGIVMAAGFLLIYSIISSSINLVKMDREIKKKLK